MRFVYFITSALCLLSVQALPADVDRSLSERAPVPAIFAQHAAQAIRKYAIGATKTMMHSGIGPGAAARIATRKGLQTVETTMLRAVRGDREKYKDTLAKYCVQKDLYCAGSGNTQDEWVNAWAQVSAAWADYAHQRTTLATHQGGPDPQSFYKTVEEPRLNSKGVAIAIDNQYPVGRD